MPNFDKYYTSYTQMPYDDVSPPKNEESYVDAPLPSFLTSGVQATEPPETEDDIEKFKVKFDDFSPFSYVPRAPKNKETQQKDVIGSVVNYAESMVGSPYKFGGLSTTTGTDCSGLVYLSYKQAGINIPRTVKEIEKFGQEIKNVNDIQPGDLLCYNSSRSPSGRHVTMVSNIDNNGDIWVINAKGKKYGIIKERADLSNIKTIRRPLTTQNITTFADDDDYIRKMRPCLAKALTNNGIDASLWTDTLVAQTSIESNWGRSQLAIQNNNFGGIKGAGSSFKTKERTSNGKYITVNSNFKKYNSIQDFADDYVKLLKNKFHAFDGSPADFTKNIKKYNYFTENLQVYNNNMNSRLNKISKV